MQGTKARLHQTGKETHGSACAHRLGFTLIEILIVISLIVLVIGLAVPALSFITGSRSVDAGENLVSAMIGRARAEAIRNGRVAGVAFFKDTGTGRSGMAIVVPAPDRGSVAPEPTGLEQYKSWRQFQEDGTTPTQYAEGDVTIRLLPDNDVGGKMTTQAFICKPPGGTMPPSTAGNGPPNTTYWSSFNQTEIDTLAGYEHQFLPPGVGVQTINDPDPDPLNPPVPAGSGRDRYLRTGLVLFDGKGALLQQRYSIAYPGAANTDNTRLFIVMGYNQRPGALATTSVPDPATPDYPLFSQMGVVLYDEENFKTAGGDDADPTVNSQSYNSGTPTGREAIEESWLDQNALSLMVNRYNGSLVRGE